MRIVCELGGFIKNSCSLIKLKVNMFFFFISIDFIQKVQTKIVMETSSSQCRVPQCFYCENDTQFFCAFCSRDFCARCQEIHSTNMSVNYMYHDVLIYGEKLRNFSKDEVCTIHPDGYSKFYCETCELPICNLCTIHWQHLSQDAWTAYKKHRHQCKNCIRIIRNDTLFNRHVLLSWINMGFKICHTFFSEIQTKLAEKARTLKNVLDNISSNFDIGFRFVLSYKIQNQMIKMRRYIAKVQNYEYQYENPSIKTIKFIIFLKRKRLFEKQDSPYLPQNIVFTIADSVNKGDYTVVLSDIQIKSKGKRLSVATNACPDSNWKYQS